MRVCICNEAALIGHPDLFDTHGNIDTALWPLWPAPWNRITAPGQSKHSILSALIMLETVILWHHGNDSVVMTAAWVSTDRESVFLKQSGMASRFKKNKKNNKKVNQKVNSMVLRCKRAEKKRTSEILIYAHE